MSPIAIVTDTDASLPPDLAANYNIRQVPIHVNFGEETLRTGSDLDDTQLFARIDREGRLPTTSAPAPGEFAAAFQSALDEGAEAVVCICVSEGLSATYEAALAGCAMLPGADVTVLDSRSLTMGLGFMALAAAEAAAAGATQEEVVARALDVRARTRLYGALSTLKYLAMSGRVGRFTAGMAGLLQVKPIVTLRDGQLDLLERVRTGTKARARVVELVLEAVAAGAEQFKQIERMAIVHVAAEVEAAGLETQLREQLRCPHDIVLAELTPGMSVHTGKGFLGVVTVVQG